MVDLSGFTPAELQRLVDEEMARRKYAAVSELKAVAEKYGYSLAQLTQPSMKDARGRRAGCRPSSKYGVVKRVINDGLISGMHAEEIAKAVGWKNSGGVYICARKLGIPMKNGRAVL